ncbi:MAG TPA: lysophospholipid acyltransferase family protein [Gemmataceae bacterium]|nr:lysophospholipid acyltransferase family protein [Gemmataceae bacterium]
MRIRHPLLIKLVAFGIALFIRALGATLRYRLQSLAPRNLHPRNCPRNERYIYAFWHEYIFLPGCMLKWPILVMISQHADGELIAQTVTYLGLHPVRGSSTRGGIEAVRQLLRSERNLHMAITPDGPRGPRRQLQPGLIYLAARTGMPIIPVGVGLQHAWRARSWDRFAIPRPGTHATCITGRPIEIPPDADKLQLEHYRQIVQDALQSTTELAERWAQNGGRWPEVSDAQSAAEKHVLRPSRAGAKIKQAG